MNYQEAISFCNSFIENKSSLGLKNMNHLLSLLGSPQKRGKYIHIAGTNGKGSVATYIETILIEANIKVGKYISPHLYRINERISINGKNIEDEDFARITKKLKTLVDKRPRLKNLLTYFEIITAIMFLYFEEEGCQISIIETGLGGRLDATNVIESPILTIITKISYDHKAILGNSIEEIAIEKANIMKEDRPCFIGPQLNMDLVNVIEKEGKRIGSKPIYINKENIRLKEENLEGQIFDYGVRKDLQIRMLGRHQLENAALALRAIDYLIKSGLPIKEEDIFKGLLEAKWPCRLEIINKEPLIIIDGAHNIDSILALMEFLRSLDIKNSIGVFSLLKDKDYKEIIAAISSFFSKIYLVPINNRRGQDLDIIEKELKARGEETRIFKSLAEGLESAISEMGIKDLLCVFGSFYLAAESKEIVKDTID